MKTTRDRHIYVRLSSDAYRKLKSRCATESTSMQDFIANMVYTTVGPSSLPSQDRGKDTKKRILNLLLEFSLLKDVALLELNKLADSSCILHFDKHQMIVREKESLDYITIIASGSVRVFKTSSSGKEFVIDVLHKGEIFGETSIISGASISAGAQAMEPTEIISIPKKGFLDLMFHNQDVMIKIHGQYEARIDYLLEKISGLISDKAKQRIIKVLLDLMHKLGNGFSFTHVEIAQMSGTTNETVTRVLTNLRNSGAIKLSRGKIQIIDKDILLSALTFSSKTGTP